MKILLFSLLIVRQIAAPAAAQTVGATNLLSNGPGAEAAAMGDATLSTVHDPTALYWNPAGLAYSGGALSGEHLFLFDGARYDFVGLSVPSDWGTFGLGALQLDRDNIVARAAIDDLGTTVSNTETDFMAGFARHLGEHVSAGATANILDFNLAGYQATALGVDVGGQAVYPGEDFGPVSQPVYSLGAVIKNLLPPNMTLISDRETYPTEYRGGLSLSFDTLSRVSWSTGKIQSDRAEFAVAFRQVAGEPAIYVDFGASYTFENCLIVRAGYDQGLTGGFGIKTLDGHFSLDYSIEDKPLNLNNRFTMTYRFSTPEKQRPDEAYEKTVDDEYARAKKEADSLAQESFSAGQSLFKDQNYRAAGEAYRLAAFLEPDDKEAARSRNRAAEAYRHSEIRKLSTDAVLDPAPGQETQAYQSIARLLDLGAENKAELAARLQKLAQRIPAADYQQLTRQAFADRAKAARVLSDQGHVRDAEAIANTLDLLKSSETSRGVLDLRSVISEKASSIRRAFDDSAAQSSGLSSGASLARSALALKRAFPDDGLAVRWADEALARYRSAHPPATKERFYVRKLYYLAAVRFVKQRDGDAPSSRDLLEEILVRDAANEDAAALLDALSLGTAKKTETTEAK